MDAIEPIRPRPEAAPLARATPTRRVTRESAGQNDAGRGDRRRREERPSPGEQPPAADDGRPHVDISV